MTKARNNNWLASTPLRPRHLVYGLVQVTWGFPQTLAGLGVFAAHAAKPHFFYHGAIATLWGKSNDMSLGPFLFMEGEPNNYADVEATDPAIFGELLVHEYGHTIQSLILGPLYLPVVGLTSAVWFNARFMKNRRQMRGTSYYAFLPERSASYLGELVLQRKAPR